MCTSVKALVFTGIKPDITEVLVNKIGISSVYVCFLHKVVLLVDQKVFCSKDYNIYLSMYKYIHSYILGIRVLHKAYDVTLIHTIASLTEEILSIPKL